MDSPTEREFADFDSKSRWNEVYQILKNEASLTTLGDEFSTKLARDPENRRKNRYRDVSPYDHSRVVLSGGQDYINASLVEVEGAGRKYILTQGPLDDTRCDFWKMTWEQKSKAVVMLNRVVEKGALKCAQYWPLGSSYGCDDEMYFPECGLRVALMAEEDFTHFSVRSLELEHMESGERREVLQFHYTTWPDFGVPSSPDAFLHFLDVVRQSGSLDPSVGPALVHCSAGIGRSGTFCLVDSCLVVVEKESTLENINLRQSLIDMRSYRMGLIQTADQLRFSYVAIIQGAQAVINGGGLGSFRTNQSHLEGPPPAPPQRTSSLSPSPQGHSPQGHTPLDLLDRDQPPALPPKTRSPTVSGFSGWDGEEESDISDEEFDKLIDRDEDDDDEDDDDDDIDDEDETSKVEEAGDSEDESQMTELRQRIREERKKQTLDKIKEMKEKQKKSERWRPYKPWFKSPSVYFGIAVIVGIAGIVAYKYLL